MKSLSKKDAVTLLEILSECLSCRTEKDFKTLVFQLQDLVHFDYTFCAYGDFHEKRFGFLNIRYPEYILQVYSKNQYQLIDPIAKEVFETLDFVSWTDARKKSPQRNVLWDMQDDTGILKGFTYATLDHDFGSMTSFSFAGEDEHSERTRAIIKTVVPHFAEVFKRVSGKKLAADRSCNGF